MADIAAGSAGSSSTPVEARSLSSITSIAANPPAYPRNPAHARHDRIELYIVRVPGSKDVVLTPHKPPTKSNISIEAINSSLYYLHAVTENDNDILRSIELEQERLDQDAPALDGSSGSGLPSDTVSRLNSFHRKPVSGRQEAAAESHSFPPPPPPHRKGLINGVSQQLACDPSHDSRFSAAHDASKPIKRKEISSPFTIPRRPIKSSGNSPTKTCTPVTRVRFSYDGTRPVRSLGSSPAAVGQRLSYDGARPVRSSGNSPIKTATPNMPATGPRFSYDGSRPGEENVRSRSRFFSRTSPSDRPSRARSTEVEPSRAITNDKPVSSFHITVIRRDTASGSQWNVATLSSSSADGGVIHVEISNPGYAKFIDNTPLPTVTMGQSAAEVLKMAQNFLQKEEEQGDDEHAGKKSFCRDVIPVKHRSRRGNSLSESLFNRGRPVNAPTLIDVASAKINRGYYTFKSPWNGTCSFVSTINGGSIKCKHLIPGPSRSAELDGRDHSDEVTVSELRYNTPFPLEQTFRRSMMSFDGSSMSPKGKEGSKRAALSQLITSGIEKAQQRARPRSASHSRSRGISEERAGAHSSPTVLDEDRLHLSLAKEQGGGGMSGKSAKLGKLIIEDEGIKMIDLVVAASMGVWWRSSYQPPTRS